MKSSAYAGLSLAILIAGPLAACAPTEPVVAEAPKVDTAKIAEAIKADVAALVASFNARDAENAVSHDAPDYIGMFHGLPNVVGPAADLELTKLQMADPNLKLEVSGGTVDVAASGEMAVWRGSYAATISDPKTGKPVSEVGNWLIGYKVQTDGTRKMSWGVVSDTGAAPAVPAMPDKPN